MPRYSGVTSAVYPPKIWKIAIDRRTMFYWGMFQSPRRIYTALVLKQFASPPLSWPRFDLVLLGMGEDGHTASLFPGSGVDISTPTLAVTAQYQDRPANRVTLTPLVFNSARRVAFLVSGESKADTLAKVLYGDYHPEGLPAQRIHPSDGELIWLVDRDAASKL